MIGPKATKRSWPALLTLLGRGARSRRGATGLALAGLVVAVAMLGPFVAPYSPLRLFGVPFTAPSPEHLLGLDYVGRDVLSRVLWGGRTILPLAVIATFLGVSLGAFLGISAGYRGKTYDEVTMRSLDVLLAIPQIILALLLISVAGTSPALVCLAVVLIHAPQVARVARAGTVRAADEDFVSYSEALGSSRLKVMVVDILPMVSTPLLVETALRLTYSIAIIASLNFLGFGTQPPTPDWGAMINENRIGVLQNPWPVVVPVLLVGVLTVGASMFADAISRAALGIDVITASGADLTRLEEDLPAVDETAAALAVGEDLS
jgi:peptide/nickel transport system permease protein